MVLAGFFMVVIISMRYRKGHDGSVVTNLAELCTILGITISPKLMNGVIPQLEQIRKLINTQSNFEWIQMSTYKNILYIFLIATMYLFAHLASKLFQDQTIMKKHYGKVFPTFNTEDFKRRRDNFCNMLRIDIKSIDIDSQWNDFYFAPLEAEVIIDEFSRPKKRSSDLLKALKDKSRENVTLILGDPGSGKSTVLRKLSKTLLDEVQKTNKIPLYINLKEWNVDEVFDERNAPQLHHLIDFIKLNLTNRLSDIWASEFITDYFDKLYEYGYFYFIFDSFDEIPMLLDETESSWLVNKISALLYSVCSCNKNTKIILSSRYFRQPTKQFQACVKMQIKPFSEASIKMCFHNFTNSIQLSAKFFSEHKEMMTIAKNPFYASLISLYYKDTKNLPTKEVDLYQSFIISRLNQCEKIFGNITLNKLSLSQVISYAQDIAVAIFENSNYGIEIPYQSVIDEVKIPESVIDILHKSKLIRVGGGSKRSISFSHRRFNEYFVACSLMDKDISSYIVSIPTNSKWRDTLVLYAQICSASKADKLVKFCCSFFEKVKTVEDVTKIHNQKVEIHKNPSAFSYFILKQVSKFSGRFLKHDEKRVNKMRSLINNDFFQALHSLRFLISAFSSQPQIILPYQEAIFEFTKVLLNDKSILNQKIAVQTVPLLSNNNIEITLDKVMEKNIAWINAEAIQNCSYLNSINSALSLKIIRYFTFMQFHDFIKGFGQTIFYLSLSKNFRKIYALCIARMINYVMALVLIPLLFLLSNILNNGYMPLFNHTARNAFTYNSNYRWTIFLIVFLLQLVVNKINTIIPAQVPYDFIKATYFNPLLPVILGILLNDIYVFFAFLLLPSKTDIVYYIYYIRCNYKFTLRLIKKNFHRFIEITIILAIIIIPLTLVVCLLPISQIVFVRVSILIMGIIIILALVAYIVSFFSDYNKFHVLEFFGNFNRQYISEVLGDLKTKYYRRKFLVYLREKNITVTGEWPDAEFPRLNDPDLDVTLAQLEEKWSGL